MFNFHIEETEIQGVLKIELDVFEEYRGNIWTSYNSVELQKLSDRFDQTFHHDKFSVSNYNVFRGFHGDNKSTKLVTCVYGEIDQYVLDWRKGSETFGRVLKFNISRTRPISIMIPAGCGNAYHVLSNQAVYHYKLSYSGNYIDSDDQFTVPWNASEIKGVFGKDFSPLTSERDK